MFKKFLSKSNDLIFMPEMRILPGQLAFFLVMSIFPLLTLIGYIGGSIPIIRDSFVSMIDSVMPNSISSVILPFITDNVISGNIIILMLIGFFLVSNGTMAIIITANELYKIKNSNWYKDKLKSILMAVVLMAVFLFALIVIAYGNSIVKLLVDQIPAFGSQIYNAYLLIKWPLSFFIIFLLVKLLYALSPSKKLSLKYTNKGAIFTTIGWILITAAYSVYVTDFANYSRFYGSLSSIIVMMMWIYLISYILVLGIAINVDSYNKGYVLIKEKHKVVNKKAIK